MAKKEPFWARRENPQHALMSGKIFANLFLPDLMFFKTYNMEKPSILIEELLERVESYGKTTFELSKLQALETTTIVASSLVARMSVITIFFLFTLVLNTGIALLLGELLGKSYYGFFIVAGFYLLAGIVLYFFLHQWIKKPVSDLIITQALK